METDSLVYTAAELTKLLKISKTTLWDGIHSGKIPNIKISEKRFLFPKPMINQWLSGQPQVVK